MPGLAHVRVFDTTLRDGEQAPGCTMTPGQKLRVARALVRLRVDVIEAGFPAASDGDWAAVRAVAANVGTDAGSPVICALARAKMRDIDRAADALEPAAHRRIHTFISTSDLHITHKLGSTRDAVRRDAAAAVAHAAARCADVEFSPEDATRSDRPYLLDILAAAVEAGATTLNIPDTVGYASPDEYADLIATVVDDIATPATARAPHRPVIVSAHCHDDLGLAVANSLAAVRAGARQVECTVNGLGERAGNAALEEVAVALAARPDAFHATTGVRLRAIADASRVVARCAGVPVPPNKAVVGANAFAHESGIHQDGVLKHRRTYEILDAESLGMEGARIVLGKHSGRHAFRRRAAALGYALDEAQVEAAFDRFKAHADRKKRVDDLDLLAILDAAAPHAADVRSAR